jgi:hypothetical protein
VPPTARAWKDINRGTSRSAITACSSRGFDPENGVGANFSAVFTVEPTGPSLKMSRVPYSEEWMVDQDLLSLDRQRTARTAGIALLVICASAMLSNDLIVTGDALATANNLRTHEGWFRIGIVGEFTMLNADIVLAVALYLLLAPVHRPLALLGSIWRLANAGLLAVGVVANLVALDSVTNSSGTLQPRQASVMTMWLDAHGSAESVGLIFFGLGAGVHSYLFYRSRYISAGAERRVPARHRATIHFLLGNLVDPMRGRPCP